MIPLPVLLRQCCVCCSAAVLPVMKKNQVNLQYYWIVLLQWTLTSRLIFCCNFGDRECPFTFLDSKIFLSRTQLWYIADFSLPSYIQLIKHTCICKQSGGWGLVPTHHCPQIWRSKKNSNSTLFIELYSGVSEQIKSLQPIGQAAEFKFESILEPLPVCWQSFLEAIPEDKWRFWLQNQWQSS